MEAFVTLIRKAKNLKFLTFKHKVLLLKKNLKEAKGKMRRKSIAKITNIA